MNRVLFLMGLVCGIVGIILGTTGLVAATSEEDSNDNDDVSDGQQDFTLYENSDYGFSIEYSSDWTTAESNLQEFEVVKFQSDTGLVQLFVESADPLNTTIYEISNAISSSPDRRTISETNTTLLGLPAVQTLYYMYEFGMTGKAMGIGVLDSNNDLISIRYLAEPEYFDENLPIVNHMIDSFRLGTNE